MARDPKKPLTFQLPDNDNVALVTWDYIINKLTEDLTETIDVVEEINKDLKLIDAKIGKWLEESN